MTANLKKYVSVISSTDTNQLKGQKDGIIYFLNKAKLPQEKVLLFDDKEYRVKL